MSTPVPARSAGRATTSTVGPGTWRMVARVTMRWRRHRRPDAGHATDALAPSFPDCWLAAEDLRELRCWGAPDADPDGIIGVWLWFTGIEATAVLDDDERSALLAATAMRPLADAPIDARARLARRIGHRRLGSEHDRWVLWSVPVDRLEAVLATALTRTARAGRLHSPVVA